MTREAAVPAEFMEQVRRIAREEVAALNRSGALRTFSLAEGGSFTLRGGLLRLIYKTFNMLYVGPVTPSAGDGTPQQGFRLRRADGTLALQIHDAFPGADGNSFEQAMTWFDRSGNAVFADDTDSGQGIARPWLPGVWQLARTPDWPLTTSGTFETVYRAKMTKQSPRLRAAVWGWSDTPGGVGEIQLTVNGAAFGSTVSTSNGAVAEFVFGPLPVTGAHMSELVVEIQARLVSGGGAIRCCPSTPPEGRQT